MGSITIFLSRVHIAWSKKLRAALKMWIVVPNVLWPVLAINVAKRPLMPSKYVGPVTLLVIEAFSAEFTWRIIMERT